MPGLRGDELLKQIHLRSPKTLAILLSGQADAKLASSVRLVKILPSGLRCPTPLHLT
ncbi:MAG: hypothetical protein LH679_05830 [Cyanobacteria bacterium CAN_BIN43]|nr:hypothetical protein [Cyanobacteria bacterium CAN_BIN43]